MNAGIDFLEFKPSEIAAAVAISVAGEAQPVDPEKAIPLLIQQLQMVMWMIKWSKNQTLEAHIYKHHSQLLFI